MKTNNVTVGSMNPTATIAINKGRVKIYNKKSNTPTYYLQKGQEFQIEIFNQTQDKVLAKIKLNNKLISQNGLVLRPGERIFLDRYFDIDKKFKFDTYEVSGGNEVKQAIRDNGDIEILFYKEDTSLPFVFPTYTPTILRGYPLYNDGTTGGGYVGGTLTNDVLYSQSFDTTGGVGHDITLTNSGNATLDSLESIQCSTSSDGFLDINNNTEALGRSIIDDVERMKKLKGSTRGKGFMGKRRRVNTKKIETGRVEEGSTSSQTFERVQLDFQSHAFHTVSYKLLPVSQKNVEAQDLHKSYCSNCGATAKAKDNFCSKCGRKI
jgi:ribosomal protein S4